MGQGSATARGGGERARTALAVLGWAAVGVAAPLLVRGLWLGAIACIGLGTALLWGGGVLLTPRSANAYLRRVTDAMTTGTVEAEAAWDEHTRRGAALRKRCRRLKPPPGMARLHERLLAVSEEEADGDAVDLAGRAERVAARLAELGALRRELAGAGATEAERRYAYAATELLAERVGAYNRAVARAEVAVRRTRGRLARARPPRRAETEHAALLDAFVAYARAESAVLAACRDGNPVTARAAGVRAEAAFAAAGRAWDALVDALGDELRRPAARTTDEPSRS